MMLEHWLFEFEERIVPFAVVDAIGRSGSAMDFSVCANSFA